jgi:hypothetical protein
MIVRNRSDGFLRPIGSVAKLWQRRPSKSGRIGLLRRWHFSVTQRSVSLRFRVGRSRLCFPECPAPLRRCRRLISALSVRFHCPASSASHWLPIGRIRGVCIRGVRWGPCPCPWPPFSPPISLNRRRRSLGGGGMRGRSPPRPPLPHRLFFRGNGRRRHHFRGRRRTFHFELFV